MGIGDDGANNQTQDRVISSPQELLEEVERVLRRALEQDRPRGIEQEVVKVYRGTDDPQVRTEALLAACLSGWPSLLRHLDESREEGGPFTLEEFAALLIHRVWLRKRRQDYRDQQTARQVDRAHRRTPEGDFLPFDPQAPAGCEEFMKNLDAEIAWVLGKRSMRDRLVLDLWLNEPDGIYEVIVKKVEAALPGQAISNSTVSRIVERFRDDLRVRLEEE